jgi:hypothetical protein
MLESVVEPFDIHIFPSPQLCPPTPSQFHTYFYIIHIHILSQSYVTMVDTALGHPWHKCLYSTCLQRLINKNLSSLGSMAQMGFAFFLIFFPLPPPERHVYLPLP